MRNLIAGMEFTIDSCGTRTPGWKKSWLLNTRMAIHITCSYADNVITLVSLSVTYRGRFRQPAPCFCVRVVWSCVRSAIWIGWYFIMSIILLTYFMLYTGDIADTWSTRWWITPLSHLCHYVGQLHIQLYNYLPWMGPGLGSTSPARSSSTRRKM